MLATLLIVIMLLSNCSSTKNIGSSKPLKIKDILGDYVLDSISCKTLIYPYFSIRLMKRHKLLFQIPYRGDNGNPKDPYGNYRKFYKIGSWNIKSETLLLTFDSTNDKNIQEESFVFRSDSLIPLDKNNQKIYIKRE